MRVLITGSQGHVGTHVTRLFEDEFELTLLDARAAPAGAQRHRFIQGDLMDDAICRQAVDGVEGIVHLAASPTPYAPHTYQRNTVSTWNLCEAAARAGVRRIAFASTINVCGLGRYKLGPKEHTPPYLPLDENVPCYPEDPYGLSKVANEQVLRAFAEAHDIKAYCFRLAHVWMPGRLENYQPAPLERIAPLTTTRIIDPWHYIEVRDVAAAFRLALVKPEVPEFGASYMVADDTTRPELTRDILSRFVPQWLPLAGDRLQGHAAWFSTARAKADLGWQPRYTWRDNGQNDLVDGTEKT